MQKPKSMDQLKPNFGNRSHFYFTCETKIWHMLQCGYCRVGNINLFYTSSHFYFLSYSSFSSSSTYQNLRLIPSFHFLHLPIRFQVLFLLDFPLPIPSLPRTIFITFYPIFCHWSSIPFITTFSTRRLLQGVWRHFHDVYRTVITASLHEARIQLQTRQEM